MAAGGIAVGEKPSSAPPPGDFAGVNAVADARARRKAAQAFYTPLALCERLARWADVSEHTRCLEPSAGDGRLVHALRAAGATRVDACEADAALHPRVRAAGGEVVGGDFLAYAPGPVYDRVVMNPPFRGRQAERHLEHAWALLRPGGLVLSVAPLGVVGQLTAEGLSLPGCVLATHEVLAPGWFAEYGTRVRVAVVELHRDGPEPPAAVDGWGGLATCNAALVVQCDPALSAAWAGVRGEPPARLVARTRAAVAADGGSCYGVDWAALAVEFGAGACGCPA